jgi:hypothetical protein
MAAMSKRRLRIPIGKKYFPDLPTAPNPNLRRNKSRQRNGRPRGTKQNANDETFRRLIHVVIFFDKVYKKAMQSKKFM